MEKNILKHSEKSHGMKKNKFFYYWQLIKSYQTGLLLITGITGFVSARCPVYNLQTLLGLTASLFLTISGSTILNMVYDRDIDAKMDRTRHRPLPSGKIRPAKALMLGIIFAITGLAIAFYMSMIYGAVILAGLFLDIAVYTIWLKRRSAWSIVWGGISGGMPILAGRVLAAGGVDAIGVLLSLSILLWIPTHILTFNMCYFDDYAKADIPTIPSKYGYKNARLMIAISTSGAAIAIFLGALSLGLSWGFMRLVVLFSICVLGLAFASIIRPSLKINFILFKSASVYMLLSMLLILFEVLA